MWVELDSSNTCTLPSAFPIRLGLFVHILFQAPVCPLQTFDLFFYVKHLIIDSKVVVISITWLISLIDIWYISDIFKENIKQNIIVCKFPLDLRLQLKLSRITPHHNPERAMAHTVYTVRSNSLFTNWTACEWLFNFTEANAPSCKLYIHALLFSWFR